MQEALDKFHKPHNFLVVTSLVASQGLCIYEYIYIYIYLVPEKSTLKWLAINWMIRKLYIKSASLTKHPLKTGCLEFQVHVYIDMHLSLRNGGRQCFLSGHYVTDEATSAKRNPTMICGLASLGGVFFCHALLTTVHESNWKSSYPNSQGEK